MWEEYAENKFNLLTICLGKQIVSDLWYGEKYKEQKKEMRVVGERKEVGGGRGSS